MGEGGYVSSTHAQQENFLTGQSSLLTSPSIIESMVATRQTRELSEKAKVAAAIAAFAAAAVTVPKAKCPRGHPRKHPLPVSVVSRSPLTLVLTWMPRMSTNSPRHMWKHLWIFLHRQRKK